MVEDILSIHKPKVKVTNEKPQEKPKSIYSWTETDVQKWLKRHCTDLYSKYNQLFRRHEITGRALLRINDNALLRLGVIKQIDRRAICREIVKLKLKTDIMEVRDLQEMNLHSHMDALNALK